MNSQELLREFIRKYSGTFFFTKPTKEAAETLIQCLGIDMNSDGVTATMIAEGFNVGKLKYTVPSESIFVFKIPPCGVFQVNHSAVVVQRLPARQWARGICKNNTEIRDSMFRIFNSLHVPWNLDTINEIFKEKVFTFSEARQMLASDKYLSVALRNGFAVGINTVLGEEDQYVLTHFGDVVGTVGVKKGQIDKCFIPSYKPQLEKVVSQ